jgi:hypothetical protein
VHPARVSRRNTLHVRTSSACWLGTPCTSISKKTLHATVHASPSPVSRLLSRMCFLRTKSGGWLVWIAASDCFTMSSHLQNDSRAIHSVHPPRMFLLVMPSARPQST